MGEQHRGRWLGGLVLIAIGVFFMLDQLGYINMDIGELLRTYWPLILIVTGLNALLSGALWGLILLGIGGFFQLTNLGYLNMSPGEFFKLLFPLILVFIGVSMLFKPRKYADKWKNKKNGHWNDGQWGGNYDPHYSEPQPLDDDFDKKFNKEFNKDFDKEFNKDFNKGINKEYDMNMDYDSSMKGGPSYSGPIPPPPMGSSGDKRTTVNKAGFIGDIHLGSDFWELKPMNISHFIGDTVLDLTKAQVPYGETKVTVSSFIGDVKVYVPNDMDLGVVVTSSSFLGDVKVFGREKDGFINNLQVETPYFYEAGKKVRIVVSTFIGDVKVMRVG
ncbi:cell wall-active antibiotics response protein LiaF [Paenibacillus apiarius]|uniref:Cell wall-active antibiotics response protein LiaF n=1 Tax=Paenibacillus apiarius TaxID=46240 RepID=A0ABT4DV00_9BACL|nr:cell wall-active antibiotics response protein LiaF [Paenibacillus apiarius]MCY9516659.1 cell wall-active antibiotics response protein LiaF [Paenibacillus apiarius]MCY9519943.1 cell wall-active antibiotics response protein LiaF [Paenibacillus apiarius]MCY9553819.1 cell wall-active antibiotics response protein LiaF [Paenibacillus apiarius]MCY9557573.1 cell wall-active antibiotics response protein LiaF [Paenibacillus apiarius]MCY9685533.1 cell wall-active antibiotics response protein LiaF [Pae